MKNNILEKCAQFEELAKLAASKKNNSKAKVRSRGKCCLPAEHSMVTDNKDHYPIGDKAHALNAISRVNQHKSVPPWFKGTLKQLINIVYRRVKAEYPGIDLDLKKKKPGKG